MDENLGTLYHGAPAPPRARRPARPAQAPVPMLGAAAGPSGRAGEAGTTGIPVPRRRAGSAVISDIDIAVLGAGAAGLTAAYSLKALGLVPFEDFVVLDAEPAPGGTWQRGWDFSRIGLAKEVVELPGMPELGLEYRALDPETPTREAVPTFHRRYEDAYELFVMRPARVTRVEPIRRRPELTVSYRLGIGEQARERSLRARIILNATGHWSSPFIPFTPGVLGFQGRQFHVAELESLEECRGRRVLVVGGGRSALAVLQELEFMAPETLWATRRAPDFIEAPRLSMGRGRVVPASAEADQRIERILARGSAFPSDVSLSGIPLTRRIASSVRSGYLHSRGPIERFMPRGVRFADGSEAELDVVLWATGFRESIRHLAPLRLRESGGMARVREGWSRRDRRIAFLGYGPGRGPHEALDDGISMAEQAIEALDRLRA